MIASIGKEIALSSPEPGESIETIYFGGGTPSILSIAQLSFLLETIQSKFNVSKHAEITLEANPDDINKVSLTDWINIGINRLSVGIQSFQEDELMWMNRAHNASDSIRCIEDIVNSDFTNYSVDLIYGSPLLSDDDFKKNIDLIFSYNVPHISCYALTVEPQTALDHLIRNNKSLPVDNEKQSAHFLLLMDWMRAGGYEHYEISNFAKPGMYSRHNSSYWSGIPYYGFGPSAHSFNGKDKRSWNVANNALYLQSLHKGEIPITEEILTVTQRLNEQVMISLRTAKGLDLKNIEDKFGAEVKTTLIQQSAKHLANATLVYENGILRLTDGGKLLADGIAADLFFIAD